MEKTQRGFAYKEFTDLYGTVCTIQKSSLATEDAIWLGAKKLKVQELVHGEGWKEVVLTDDIIGNERMHLSQEMVKELLPILQKFVETGEL